MWHPQFGLFIAYVYLQFGLSVVDALSISNRDVKSKVMPHGIFWMDFYSNSDAKNEAAFEVWEWDAKCGMQKSEMSNHIFLLFYSK